MVAVFNAVEHASAAVTVTAATRSTGSTTGQDKQESPHNADNEKSEGPLLGT